MNAATLERFWAKVNKSGYGPDGFYREWNGTPCYAWTASTRNKGYGAFSYTDETGRLIQERAHRIAWTLAHGPIPKGLRVLHHCDYPPCSNEAHLFLGTNQDNVDDMMAKGRHVKGGTYCAGDGYGDGNYKRGDDHPGSKISEADVLVLKVEREVLGTSYGRLALKYGLSLVQVYRICKGQRRKR